MILDVKIVGIALRRAEIHNLIDRNPVPAAKLPKSVSSEREVFSHEDVQRLLDAAPKAEASDYVAEWRLVPNPLRVQIDDVTAAAFPAAVFTDDLDLPVGEVPVPGR